MSSMPPGQETAVAVIVAPDSMDEAIAAVPSDRLLPLIWWLDEIIRRANAARKAAIIEATVALEHNEITDPRITVNGHRYHLREDVRTEWADVPELIYGLTTMGIPISDIARAINGLRVTDLRRAVERIDDADARTNALETIEGHRVKRPTGMALVDLDAEWRR